MPDTTEPNITVLGGHGLSRADVERLYPEDGAVRTALLAPVAEAEARPLPAVTAEFLPRVGTTPAPCGCGCADCEGEAARALAAAEAEGMIAPATAE